MSPKRNCGSKVSEIQDNVDCCCVRHREETRRAHFARPQARAFEPSLAEKRRAEALYAEIRIFFNQASEPSTMTDCCLLLCVYSRMTRSHDRRELGAMFFLVS